MAEIDIEKLAREAGFRAVAVELSGGLDPLRLIQPNSSTDITVEVRRFAALVLEEAANLAKSNSSDYQQRADANDGRQSDMAFGQVVASNFIEGRLRTIAEGLKP